MQRFAILILVIALSSLGIQSSLAASANGSWDPRFQIPPGLNGDVYAIMSLGDDIYVGGAFTKAGGISSTGIAK